MLEMNATCRIAMYHFCRLNGWDIESISAIGKHNGIYDLQIHEAIRDVDDIRIIPDEYTIGPVYTENHVHFEIFKNGKMICILYPKL